MLERLHPDVRILSQAEGATAEAIAGLVARFPALPEAFLRLFAEATELELSYRGIYLRLYGPSGCVEMDEAYSISQSVPGAITVGDNGGCEAIVVLAAGRRPGIHRVGYGDLDPEELVFIAPTLEALLFDATPPPDAVGGCEAQ